MLERPKSVALAATAALALLSGGAAAEEKATCMAAAERAQQLRDEGKFTAAREQLAICGRAECPKIIQQDCGQWMTELLQTVPTVVLGAKDAKGRDLVNVRASVDGKVVATSLDGKALPIDPGVHTLKFESAGVPPVEQQVVIRQGEKNRSVTVTIVGGADPAKPAEDPKKPERKAEGQSPPILAYSLAGAGVVALGVALAFQLDANGEVRHLRDTCAPHCKQEDVDGIQQRWVMAGVTAGVGGALLVAGGVLWLTHKSGGDAKTDAARRPSTFGVQPLPGGGMARLSASF